MIQTEDMLLDISNQNCYMPPSTATNADMMLCEYPATIGETNMLSGINNSHLSKGMAPAKWRSSGIEAEMEQTDIDNYHNPQCVAVYATDIFNYLRSNEVNYRKILLYLFLISNTHPLSLLC